MSLLDKLKGELVDIIEWMDDSRSTLAWRFPRYRNENKPFQVYINGVTGEVHGARPFSKVKIITTVLPAARCPHPCRTSSRTGQRAEPCPSLSV